MAKAAKSAGETNGRRRRDIETAVKTGAEALKVGFEKAVKNYDQMLGYGKETVEACVKSASVAGKGAETLHNEIYAYSKQSIEDSIAAAKAVLGSKSVHEAFELQTDFAKTAFEAYVGEMTKLSRNLRFDREGSVRAASGPRPGLGRSRSEGARRLSRALFAKYRKRARDSAPGPFFLFTANEFACKLYAR